MTTFMDATGTTTTLSRRLRLRADLSATTDGGSPLRVGSDRSGWVALSASGREVIAALTGPGRTEAEIAEIVTAAVGEQGLLGMHLLLARLGGSGFLEHVVEVDGCEYARLYVVGHGPIAVKGRVPDASPVKLSRFATAVVEDGRLVVRVPRSHLALVLAPEAAGLLGALATWSEAGTVAARLDALPGDAVAALLRLAAAAQLLAPGGPDDDIETTSAQGQWNSADLWLHAHTRDPASVAGYGGTYHGRGRREPLAAVPPPTGARLLDLPTPDLTAVAASDPTFTEVLERRRSVRAHDDGAPITVEQLGELLYRAARLRRTFSTGQGEEVADRPYPSGGASHELEIYPLVSSCPGVDPGLWHYRTDTHQLELVAEPDGRTAGLVARARTTAVIDTDPQVVLLITARFGRVMFKYESIAYSLVLKHVGVLYQTLYLVATAMDLAVCGLGGGDANLFAAASGRDYFAESTVGELVVGSRPPGLSGGDRWKAPTP